MRSPTLASMACWRAALTGHADEGPLFIAWLMNRNGKNWLSGKRKD
jgi:hypothetical protein